MSEPFAQLDYWLNKVCFDVQNREDVRAAFRQDREAVLDRYPLAPDVREAIRTDDVARLAPLTNPYLLRYFFYHSGMGEDEFIRRIRAIPLTDPTTATEVRND